MNAALKAGLAALQSNELTAARESLERATRESPADPRAWMGLAQTYRKLDMGEASQQAAAKAESLAPDDPIVLHGMAMYYAEAGQWSDAAEREARYAAIEESDALAWARAASFFLQADTPAKAVEMANRAPGVAENPGIQNLLGKAYASLGDRQQAESALRQALKLRPYEESFHYDLGYFFLRTGEFDRAVEALEKGKEIFDRSPRIELGLGIAYYGQRKFESAVDSYLRAAELAPGMEQPHYFLSRVLAHASTRLSEVRRRFAAFAEARPESYLGPYLKGVGLLAEAGPSATPDALAQAEQWLAESIQLNGKFWESHFELGSLLANRRDFESAEDHLKRGIELNPTSSKAHSRLARVYSRLGKTNEAQAERDLHAQLVEKERQAMRTSPQAEMPENGIVK
jgi:Flp pilus assembly protein TadD